MKWRYIGAYTFFHVLCLICVEYLCPFFEGQKKFTVGYYGGTACTPCDTKARNSNSKILQASFNAARPSFTARICSLLVVSFTPIITSLTLAVFGIFGDLLGKI